MTMNFKWDPNVAQHHYHNVFLWSIYPPNFLGATSPFHASHNLSSILVLTCWPWLLFYQEIEAVRREDGQISSPRYTHIPAPSYLCLPAAWMFWRLYLNAIPSHYSRALLSNSLIHYHQTSLSCGYKHAVNFTTLRKTSSWSHFSY